MKLPPLTNDWNYVSKMPTQYLAGVGDIISQWAQAESLMTTIVGKAMRVDPKLGRYAVRQVPARQFCNTVRTLLDFNRIPLRFKWSTIHTRLEKGKELRDLVAHGAWMAQPTTSYFGLRVVRGHHEDERYRGTLRAFAPSVHAEWTPTFMLATADHIRETNAMLGDLDRRIKESVDKKRRKEERAAIAAADRAGKKSAKKGDGTS